MRRRSRGFRLGTPFFERNTPERCCARPGLRQGAQQPDLTSWVSKEAGYAGIVVANYLHRPLLPAILAALAPGGLLLYETFARGNERFGRPSSPDYLLKRGELLEVVRGRLQVLAYEDLVVQEPRPAAVQRIAARRLE